MGAMNAATAVAELRDAAAAVDHLNLGQFAKVVGSTEPTVRKRVDEAGDGDWLIERGSKGRDYKIHPVLGPLWWREEEERRRQEEAAKDEAVDQLRMTFLGDNALQAEVQGLSASDRLKELEVQKALRIEARERGVLVDRGALQRVLGNTMAMLSKQILSAAKTIGREADLKPAQRSEWEERVEKAMNAAIDRCQEALQGEL